MNSETFDNAITSNTYCVKPVKAAGYDWYDYYVYRNWRHAVLRRHLALLSNERRSAMERALVTIFHWIRCRSIIVAPVVASRGTWAISVAIVAGTLGPADAGE